MCKLPLTSLTLSGFINLPISSLYQKSFNIFLKQIFKKNVHVDIFKKSVYVCVDNVTVIGTESEITEPVYKSVHFTLMPLEKAWIHFPPSMHEITG